MLVRVKVRPGRGAFHLEDKNGYWLVDTKAQAESGMANAEIIHELSKKYKTVRIVRGAKSRNKRIEVI